MRRLALALALALLALPAWGQVGSRTFVEGDPDYVTMGDVLDSTFAGTDVKFSVAGWAKFDNTERAGTKKDTLIAKYGAGGSCAGERQFVITVDGGGCGTDSNAVRAVSLLGNRGDTYEISCSSDDSVNDTNWHFLAATYDNTQSTRADRWQIYVDGVLDVVYTATGGSDLEMSDTAAKLTLGAQLDSLDVVCDAGWNMDGQMAYWHAYSGILTIGEVNTLMHCPGSISDGLVGYWPLTDGTTQYDQSGNANNGTNSGTAASTDGPPISVNCATAGGN